jgi:hypothetical protein
VNDLYQSGPLPPPGRANSAAPDTATTTAEADERVWRSFDELTAEKITAARHAYYAVAAVAVRVLQNGQRLVGEQMFAAAYAQTFRIWWERVEVEATTKKISSDHAVRRVRSWARHYLTGEPPAPQPGTLFDHGLAHASRLAARDFLNTSGHLLTQHLAEHGSGPGDPGPGTPADHRPGCSATPPAARAALSPTTADTA